MMHIPADSDLFKTLAEARDAIRKLKEEKAELSERDSLILKNNLRFAELVLLLERKIRTLVEEHPKAYKYSYGTGWMEKDSADPNKLKIVKADVSAEEINNQLEEILRLIRQHRKKE